MRLLDVWPAFKVKYIGAHEFQTLLCADLLSIGKCSFQVNNQIINYQEKHLLFSSPFRSQSPVCFLPAASAA